MQTCYRQAVKRSYRIAAILVAGAALLASCQSAPEEIPADLSQMEMFQRAQEAADQDRYDLALRYYEAFIDRYPDDPGAVMEARYEIAFIAYKQEEYDSATAQFEEILADYDADTTGTLPAWPRVLSQKLVEQIDAIRAEDGLLDTGDQPTADGSSTEPDTTSNS